MVGFPNNPWFFLLKNDHFEVFWGYHHFRKHAYMTYIWCSVAQPPRGWVMVPPPCGCGAVVWGCACQRAASRTMMPKRRKCACKSYNDPSCLFRDAHQKPWPWRRRLFSLSLRMNHCGITPSNLLGADFSSSCANLAPTVHPGVLAGWQNCTALLSKCFSTSVW